MYGCESWTMKKAEYWRIDIFELRSWRRLLRVPWMVKRSNQSIPEEINPEYSLEGLMLKLKLQYFGHPMSWLKQKTEGQRRRGQQRIRWLDASLTRWAWVWANSGRWWRTGKPGVLQSIRLQRMGHNWTTEQQQREIIIVFSVFWTWCEVTHVKFLAQHLALSK